MKITLAISVVMMSSAVGCNAEAQDKGWSGLYAGASAGVGWSGQASATNLNALDPIFFNSPNALQAFSTSGSAPYVASPELSIFVGAQKEASDRIIIGSEFELTGSRQHSVGSASGYIHGSESDASLLDAFYDSHDTATTKATLDWSAAFKARVGFLPSDNVLLFVTAGPTVARVTINANHSATGFNTIFYGEAIPPMPQLLSSPFSASNSGSITQATWGITLGTGIEYKLSQNIRLRGEITYARYESVFLTVPCACTLVGADTYSVSPRTGAAKLGIVYGF